MFVFFFSLLFKQKTAYEMRITDWSSDVCSADLSRPGRGQGPAGRADRQRPWLYDDPRGRERGRGMAVFAARPGLCQCPAAARPHAEPRAPHAAVVGVGWADAK